MNFKSFVKEVALFAVCCLPPVILVVLMLYWLSDNAKVYQPVANEVANEVTNTVPNMVTETEVYKVVCTEAADTFCKEYSVRRINRE